MSDNLFIFGCGYSSCTIAKKSSHHFQSIFGTTRSTDNHSALSDQNITSLTFDGDKIDDNLITQLSNSSHLLISIAPNEFGDPVLNTFKETIETSTTLQWIGYLSTVGVYGHHEGSWVDESNECKPESKRSIERFKAEKAWQVLAKSKDIPLSIFRLSGIYGPGRNAFINMEKGTARRLVKKGQVFNRIHRDDIATAVDLAISKNADGIFNITDDEPSPPQDVVTFAHELAGVEPPVEIDFETADISPMARSFYGENKRVSNAKSKKELGLDYEYPNYRESLSRMWNESSWQQ